MIDANPLVNGRLEGWRRKSLTTAAHKTSFARLNCWEREVFVLKRLSRSHLFCRRLACLKFSSTTHLLAFLIRKRGQVYLNQRPLKYAASVMVMSS
jgi:hypothetical protein